MIQELTQMQVIDSLLIHPLVLDLSQFYGHAIVPNPDIFTAIEIIT